jgi:hypothetical protein
MSMRIIHKLSAEERETIILFNEANATAEIEAYSPAMRKRLATLSREYPKEVFLTKRGEESDRYTFPKRWLKIAAPRTTTDKQQEHLKKARDKIFT